MGRARAVVCTCQQCAARPCREACCRQHAKAPPLQHCSLLALFDIFLCTTQDPAKPRLAGAPALCAYTTYPAAAVALPRCGEASTTWQGCNVLECQQQMPDSCARCSAWPWLHLTCQRPPVDGILVPRGVHSGSHALQLLHCGICLWAAILGLCRRLSRHLGL